MNNVEEGIVSSISGTSMMTLFSYLVSLAENDNFSEPENLGALIHRLFPTTRKSEAVVIGWTIHYMVGFMFVIIYKELWRSGKIRKTIANGIILGICNGLIGSAVWNWTLQAHPFPKKINFSRYLMHLIPAHIVFAICATLTDLQLDQKRSVNSKNNRSVPIE